MESNNSVSCKLKIPKNLSNNTPAYLVNFSNGNINFNCSSKLHFASYRHVNDRDSSENKRILVANNDRLNYVSSIGDKSDVDTCKLRYYIGVRNKASGKMKVYDTLSFHLKPSRKDNLQSSSTEARNVKERFDDLTASFGSKSKKRSMTAQQKYSTSHEPLDQALKDMSLDESMPSTGHSSSTPKISSNIDYIPPQNRNAGSVDEVYDINDIISTEEDNYLSIKANLFLQDLPTHFSQWKSDGTYCDYVLKHLEDSVDNVKAKYLLYYNYLAIFSRLLASDIKKKDPAPEIPEPIKSSLLDRYTVSSVTEMGRITRNFSKLMKDKLLAYMLVLALIIDDYNVDLSLLQKGTKHGTVKVSNIAQVLGCYVTRRKIGNSAIQFAELKLPLFIFQKHYKKF